MTTEGNHEVERGVQDASAEDGDGADTFVAYNLRYRMPPLADDVASPSTNLQAAGPNNNFYSFEHGAVTWLMLGG